MQREGAEKERRRLQGAERNERKAGNRGESPGGDGGCEDLRERRVWRGDAKFRRGDTKANE